jgi:hypothetical protein
MRGVLGTLVLLASLLLPQAKGAAEAVPMSVEVQLPAQPGPDLREWADELRAALAARKDEFRAPKPGAKPEFVVRLDSIGPGQNGTPTLKGSFVRGTATRAFSYTFTSVRADAEKLARNLRKLADQMARPR